MTPMKFSLSAAIALLGLAFVPLASASVQATELQVLAGGATTAPMKEIAAQFEKDTGHKLVIRYGTTPELAAMATNSAFDVGIVPHEVFKDSAALSKFVSRPVTEIVRVGLGVAVRSGAPKPDISTPNAFKQTLLKAQSIAAVPQSAAGYQVTAVFETMGIADALKDKIKAQGSPGAVVQAVASGEAELGVFLINALTAPGIDVVGPFPGDLQREVFFAARLAADAKQPDVATAFVAYVKSPAASAIFKARGMTPSSN